LFNKRASVTSFCKVLLQNIFQTHKYWKQGSEHDLWSLIAIDSVPLILRNHKTVYTILAFSWICVNTNSFPKQMRKKWIVTVTFLYEYFVTWWVFSVPFLSFFVSFCVLIFFLAVWGLGFSGGGTDWLICCNPDCFWGLRAQFPCQNVAMWGLRAYEWSLFFCTITTGSAYP
jgi:hypothetical protein